jgi:hypothetical protein
VVKHVLEKTDAFELPKWRLTIVFIPDQLRNCVFSKRNADTIFAPMKLRRTMGRSDGRALRNFIWSACSLYCGLKEKTLSTCRDVWENWVVVKNFCRFTRCFGRVLIDKTYYYCRFCIDFLVGLIQEDLTVFER